MKLKRIDYVNTISSINFLAILDFTSNLLIVSVFNAIEKLLDLCIFRWENESLWRYSYQYLYFRRCLNTFNAETKRIANKSYLTQEVTDFPFPLFLITKYFLINMKKAKNRNKIIIQIWKEWGLMGSSIYPS